jgi:signal transduction histidine kinase
MSGPFSADRAKPGEQCALRHLKASLLDRQRRFATDASHELRTPLAALRLQVEAARLHPGDVDLPELLNHVTAGLDRLEGIVDDLLLLVTIESDLDRTRQEVDLTALVETVAAGWAIRDDVRLDLQPGVTAHAAIGHHRVAVAPALGDLLLQLLRVGLEHAHVAFEHHGDLSRDLIDVGAFEYQLG